LLQPRNRTWLSDGSLPSMVTVNPAELSQSFAKAYKGRPYTALSSALSDRYQAAERLVQLELERLDAVRVQLEKNTWERAIVRLSFFDQLQHLFGLRCFDDPDLIIHDLFLQFIGRLDQFLEAVTKLECEFFCLSAYRHRSCRSRFNINALLNRHGFLATQTQTADASRRATALAAISGHPPAHASVQSIGGHLATEQTVAASPVGGCVYLNLKNSFVDGTVSDAEAGVLADSIYEVLEGKMFDYFGERARLYTMPLQQQQQPGSSLPRLILYVPEVEFFDGNETILDNQDKPAVCHGSGGFFFQRAKGQLDENMTPLDVHNLLRGLNLDSKKTFALGSFKFKLADEANHIETLFLEARQSDDAPIELLDNQGGVRGIVNVALKRHENCIWLDAGVLVAPNGKRVMFAGASSAGKSTLTTALAFGHGWKIIAEDVALIDIESDRFVVFASPLSMKAGTVDRLAKVLGKAPGPLFFNEWIPLGDLAATTDPDATIDFAFIMQPLTPGSPGQLNLQPISHKSVLTKLMPISNILRLNGAMEKMEHYLSQGKCFQLSGGQLNERLDLVIELSKNDG
jgi:hypothetical protein